jgi:oligopeptide transport system permease protein
MSTTNLTPADFAKLPRQHSADQLTRPSLSYWEDAWRRLRANPRAMSSLGLILALLAFVTLGPVIWTVDPSAQDVDQIGLGPGADRKVTLAAPLMPWEPQTLITPAASADNPLGFTVVEPATTQAVRLAWAASGTSHRLYRNLFPPQDTGSFGLPIADLDTPYFEDRLDLQPTTYYYTLVALDGEGQETKTAVTLTQPVTRVISIAEARQRGLIAPEETAEIGQTLKLAWHPLGTDYLGRDMLARLMYGGQVSLFIGLLAPLAFVLLGVIYGSVAGFLGGTVDQAMMRFADFVVALPFLLFMILFKVVFGIGPGESGILPMLVAMIILLWPAPARLVRGQILQIREEGYVGASKLLGATTPYVVGRHMLPNTLGVILVTITFQVPSAIFTEAFLSFIGMGVAPPTPSWGAMCNEGIKSMLTRPHELLFPAIMISATVLAFNLLGDGLRDALDARMRGAE